MNAGGTLSVNSLSTFDMVPSGPITVVVELRCDMTNRMHNDCVGLVNAIELDSTINGGYCCSSCVAG